MGRVTAADDGTGDLAAGANAARVYYAAGGVKRCGILNRQDRHDPPACGLDNLLTSKYNFSDGQDRKQQTDNSESG